MIKHALFLSFLSLAVAACGDDDRPRTTPDSGPTDDGGGMDSGPTPEDGGPMDAGTMDAGDTDAGDTDAGDVDGGTDAGPTPSDMIAALREMADGTGLTVSLSGVFVTYLKPAIGSEPAGFFVQGEMAGPAIFVAVDPATTTPTVEVGDELSFTVTDLATTAMLRQVTAITDLMELSTGNDVSSFVQDVSAATDLVSALDSYESERIGASFTIAAAFSGAGTGFEAAAIDTAGITGDANLRFRIPATMRAAMDLSVGCTVTVDGVMWRFNDAAQISVYEDAFVTSATCAAPTVVGAVAASATEVVVTFDRTLDAASVAADGSQFTITNGGTLAVSAASVAGSTVTLTTAAQTPGTTYTVTVAATVTDTLGTGVDATMNTAMFTGYTPPAPTVIINEVDYDNIGTDTAEFVELYNPGTVAFDLTGIELVFVNGSTTPAASYDTVALSGSIGPGEYIVVANTGAVTVPGGVTVIDLSGSIQNGAPDGVALVNTTTATLLDALSYEGSITSATIGTGTYNLVEGTATAAADSNAVEGSLSRIPDGSDTDDAATDWQFVSTPTPGAANTP